MIHKYRLMKSDSEIALMHEAGKIAGNAHRKCMAATFPGSSESFLHTILEHECKAAGAERLSYIPVVASGDNGAIIHYTNNNQILKYSLIL